MTNAVPRKTYWVEYLAPDLDRTTKWTRLFGRHESEESAMTYATLWRQDMACKMRIVLDLVWPGDDDQVS